MDKKLIIIPTYNEIENIEAITRKVFSMEGGYHILVIDDGSPDGTAAIVRSLQPAFPTQLHLLERSGKQGLGTAYLTGFGWALAKGVKKAVAEQGLLGAFTGGAKAAAGLAEAVGFTD